MDFYTLQDFFTHTKGIIYVLIVLTLIVLGGFWQFLTARDDEIDRGVFEAGEEAEHARDCGAEDDAGDDAERDPDREPFLEQADPALGSGRRR